MDIQKELRGVVAALAGLVLTGREVEVRFKEPPLDNVRGLAFRDGSKGVVFISPYLDDSQTLRTLLHEISHIRQDFDVLQDVSKAEKLAGLYLSEVKIIPSHREQMSKALAGKWISKAEELKPGGSWMEKLSALTVYYSKKQIP